jgi:hypothetical protein
MDPGRQVLFSQIYKWLSLTHACVKSFFEPKTTSRIIQQFVPVSRQSRRASFGIEKQLSFDAVNYRETLELKALLLSPWPTDKGPFVRQPINVCSYQGSVDAEIVRTKFPHWQ